MADVLITREDSSTMNFAFNLLKTILPSKAFYGRGPDLGPKMFMTDDSDTERSALHSAWPLAILLLCIFHVLQVRISFCQYTASVSIHDSVIYKHK